jgi:hypothetical protein
MDDEFPRENKRLSVGVQLVLVRFCSSLKSRFVVLTVTQFHYI